MAFVKNMLVKETIVMGLETVRRKTEMKLENKFAELALMVVKTFPFIAPFMIIIPKTTNIIELKIPNHFLIFLFSNNFPIPRTDSII